jgi:ABC-type transporter Mla MlaB component
MVLKQEAGYWQFQGKLTFNSVSTQLKGWSKMRPLGGNWHINLAQVSHVDSAGIAYLLECIRYAKKHQLEFKLLAFPDIAKPLLKVQGVAPLFLPYME